MTTLCITIFWASILLSAASYFLYPALIWLWGQILPFKPRASNHTPRVSILIAAYNEERDIAAKLSNTLSIDYPRDHFEILVGSDGSDDQTAQIVRSFSDQGVRLIDFEENRGKTAVQNDLATAATGEILVFTDAACFLPPEALLKMVRNFADDRVGCVAGRMQFVDTDRNITTESQGLYWRYESKLRQWESAIGRLIGVDGPLYAVRRENFVALPHHIISDFLIPLLVLNQKKRVVLELEAIVEEKPTNKPTQELTTRRRITLRGLVGLFHYMDLMNPLKRPLLAFQIILHKLLRWAVGPLVLLNFIACIALSDILFFKFFLFLHLLFYASALVGLATNNLGTSIKIFSVPYYFCLVNLSATLGIIDFIRKKQAVAWKPVR